MPVLYALLVSLIGRSDPQDHGDKEASCTRILVVLVFVRDGALVTQYLVVG